MAGRYRFDRFTLDTREGRLYAGSDPIHLQPKAYELLALLLDHPGDLFTREDLMARLWPDVHVTDESLSKVVSRLRRALKGCAAVKTVPRQGYRFVGEVSHDAHEGLPPAPPPAHRVPAPPELVGRDEELAEVMAALQSAPVVVIHGAPGTGKSVLARAVCGLWTGEAVEVGLGLALALGLPPATDLDALAAALRARPGLLVHVDDYRPGSAPELRQLHHRAPNVRWLLSCSTLPDWTGQQVVRLRGLDSDSAVAMLAADPDADIADLRRLAKALDHLPLALELAAPQLRHLSPAELLRRLDDRFGLLRGPTHSLEAAYRGAWNALNEVDRAAMARLATPPLSVPLQGALACIDDLDDFPLDVLQRLTDASWVRITHTETQSLVEVPPNLRAWALTHAVPADATEALTRLARWLWTDTASSAERAAEVADPAVWSIVLERTPLATALANDGRLLVPLRAQAAYLASIATRIEGPSPARLQMLDDVLAEAKGQLAPALAVSLACARSRLYRGVHRGAALGNAAHDTLELARSTGDPDLAIRAWVELALDLVAIGQHAEAEAAVHRCLELAQTPADKSRALFAASATYRFDSEEADSLRALLALPIDPRAWLRLAALLNLAIAAHDAGRWAEAEARYRERLAILGAVDPPHLRAAVLVHLANLLSARRRFAEAEPLFQHAAALAEQTGLTDLEHQTQLDWAAAEVGAGRVRQARLRLDILLRQTDRPVVQIHGRTLLGAVALRDHRPDAALDPLQEAVALARQSGRPPLAEDAQLLLAGARALSGDGAGAERDLHESTILSPGRVPPFVEAARWWVKALVDPGQRPRAIAAVSEPGPDGAPPLVERVSDLQWMLPLLG